QRQKLVIAVNQYMYVRFIPYFLSIAVHEFPDQRAVLLRYQIKGGLLYLREMITKGTDLIAAMAATWIKEDQDYIAFLRQGILVHRFIAFQGIEGKVG